MARSDPLAAPAVMAGHEVEEDSNTMPMGFSTKATKVSISSVAWRDLIVVLNIIPGILER